jgi:hypothetical protein
MSTKAGILRHVSLAESRRHILPHVFPHVSGDSTDMMRVRGAAVPNRLGIGDARILADGCRTRATGDVSSHRHSHHRRRHHSNVCHCQLTTLAGAPDSVRLHVHHRLGLLRLHHGAGKALCAVPRSTPAPSPQSYANIPMWPHLPIGPVAPRYPQIKESPDPDSCGAPCAQQPYCESTATYPPRSLMEPHDRVQVDPQAIDRGIVGRPSPLCERLRGIPWCADLQGWLGWILRVVHQSHH